MNKIYSSNNIVILCEWIWGLQFFRIMHSFPKTGAEGCYKKNLKYESIWYNSTKLLVDWTSREFQNQTMLFSIKTKSLM